MSVYFRFNYNTRRIGPCGALPAVPGPQAPARLEEGRGVIFQSQGRVVLFYLKLGFHIIDARTSWGCGNALFGHLEEWMDTLQPANASRNISFGKP